ncbi:EAL domain-containing protein [Catenovulum sp. 2E275]|uniref:GGDEF/EAL domain-containing response regulator n=1 Tax=Catenovulum sp. 2E275 TaxID=2980497 RepID=UPI0021D0D1D2|nr:EAL domain-containing protein [Catenovulum sp. 2E275]MCU4675971.1 EAL domain-containing protein [Catenovulum sp. 2E275]
MSRLIKLLLVNSNPDQTQILISHINHSQVFEIINASSATEAINFLRQYPIEVVISDIDIDGFDGWRLSRMIRSGIFRCSENIPIIIVASTWCEHIAETTAREFGINFMLPFNEVAQLPQLLADAMSSNLVQNNKVKLLAIEDNLEIQEIVERILKQRFDVEVADSGELGLKLWREKQHDIILLDVMLPGMSGEQVLAKILQENPAQPVIVMTAHGTIELAEKMIIQGAADFISKPFRADQLRKVCEIASRREDFMISNQQFADKVNELKQREIAYRQISYAHQQLLNNLTTAIVELNEQGQIQFLNKAWQTLTGYKVSECQNQYLKHFLWDKLDTSPNSTQAKIEQLLSFNIEHSSLEFKLEHKLGHEVWVEAKFSATQHNYNQFIITATIDDISKRKEAEFKLEHLALHDPLTGLHNRYHFDNELTKLTAEAKKAKANHALLYIDLDHFKVINDSQGHHQGDTVLREVSKVIENRIRRNDLLCRIGGDEFAVLLHNTSALEAYEVAESICQALKLSHFQFNEQVYKISCSIGVVCITGGEENSHEYLKQADIALYVAKRRGRDLVHIYSQDDKDSEKLRDTIEWIHQLQQAIAKDNIVLHFQPVIEIATGEVAYYEALVRLIIDGKVIFPGHFIPSLERGEDIKLLDHQVVAKAIKMLAEYPKLKKLAVNLSAHAFSDENLSPLIEQKLAQYNVSPTRLIFELTESASLSNLSATQRMIERLTLLGCGFSIDDFGTGFSTFSYLKELPAQSVKIDGSFVKDMKTDPIDKALVKAIYDISKSLGKKSVAEFVEDKETLTMLAELGVDYAQGYFIARPVPIEQALAIQANQWLHSA